MLAEQRETIMDDTPIPAFNPFVEANTIPLDPTALTPRNHDNWMSGFSEYAIGVTGGPFKGVSINVYKPSIYMGLTQLAIVEQQNQWSFTVLSLENNIRILTAEMEGLKEEIRHLCRTRTFVVPLTTLEPGPFQITQQIPVTIQGDGEDFTATFTEANVSASGETEADAIANFKESLVSRFEILQSKSAKELGPLPARQWRILQSVVKRVE
jgi:hypothetical protein